MDSLHDMNELEARYQARVEGLRALIHNKDVALEENRLELEQLCAANAQLLKACRVLITEYDDSRVSLIQYMGKLPGLLETLRDAIATADKQQKLILIRSGSSIREI